MYLHPPFLPWVLLDQQHLRKKCVIFPALIIKLWYCPSIYTLSPHGPRAITRTFKQRRQRKGTSCMHTTCQCQALILPQCVQLSRRQVPQMPHGSYSTGTLIGIVGPRVVTRQINYSKAVTTHVVQRVSTCKLHDNNLVLLFLLSAHQFLNCQ